MATVSEMMEIVWRPPRAIGVKRRVLDRKLPEHDKYYRNWGFTIYRTYYGAESDKHWDMLLDALKRQTMLALASCEDQCSYKSDLKRRHLHWGMGHQDEDEYRGDLERLKKLFRLDAREDASLLGGLDVRQLREVCLSEERETERTMAGGQFGYVLAADESVLKDIAKGEFVVKAVAYDWEENGDYWGWMRIPTGYLLELWHSLMMLMDNPHRVLRFNGPEEDLDEHIWPGKFATHPTGSASEVRPPGSHYTAQEPMFTVERKK